MKIYLFRQGYTGLWHAGEEWEAEILILVDNFVVFLLLCNIDCDCMYTITIKIINTATISPTKYRNTEYNLVITLFWISIFLFHLGFQAIQTPGNLLK